MLQTLRKSASLIGRERRGRWITLVFLAVAASLLEMAGAVLVYVLMALVADPTSGVAVPLVGDVRTLAGNLSDRQLVLAVAATVAGFFVVRAVFQMGVTYAQQRLAHNAGVHLSHRLVNRYLALPYIESLRRSSADLIHNAQHAVIDLVVRAFIPVINVTSSAILIVGMVVVMVAIAPVATVMAVLVIGTAALILLRVVQPRFREAGEQAHRMMSRTLRALQQAFAGGRDIRLLGRERFFFEAYAKDRERLGRAHILRGTYGELPRYVIETALVAFIVVYFALATLAGRSNDDVVGVLGLFAYAGLRLQPSLYRLVGGLNELKYASAAIDAVSADLRTMETTVTSHAETERLRFEHAIVLDDVSFRYAPGEPEALSRVSLTIVPGEIVGICGPTGGGKTTLVDLICGLLHPTRGLLTVDGCDVREYAREWQANLGLVPQRLFLIDDTLRRNVALGTHDDEIDDDAVTTAVRLSQLETFVAALPGGLETVVGESGVRLSGGQQQRVAIARALYRSPTVLVFDEATSALDNVTEAQLMNALEALRGRHTIIVVAHRLSTVEHADRIVYLEEGRVGAIGSFSELLETHAGFRGLARTSKH